MAPEVQETAIQIGQFYLQKNGDDYAKAEKEIHSLRIRDLQVDGNKVTIILERPGLIIGRKGSNIDALKAFLGKEVCVVEDKDALLSWLIPFQPYVD